MSTGRLISVKTELVMETIVGQIAGMAGAGPAVVAALAMDDPPGDPDAPVAVRLSLAAHGYHARGAERELFEVARSETPGLAEALELRVSAGADDASAIRAESLELAAREPLHRPAPDDHAFTWRVPGPGGHVRHHVAERAAAERGRAVPDLKRAWVYGFAARCCEEALARRS